MRLWRLSDGKELLRLISFEEPDGWLAMTPDGLFDGSSDAWKQLTFRDASSRQVMDPEAARRRFHRPAGLMSIVKKKLP